MVTLRCDPLAEKKAPPQIRFPSQCPDGTCDGCVYQLLILSRRACPLCSERDYKRIAGVCQEGKQTIHFIPAKYAREEKRFLTIPARHCVLAGEDEQRTETGECTVFPLAVQVLIAVGTGVAFLLLVAVCLVWKKNKRYSLPFSPKPISAP